MKRQKDWLRGVCAACLALVVGAVAASRWLAPRYVMRAIERASGGTVAITAVDLSFPLTTTLTGLRLTGNTAEAALSIPRVVIRPRWFFLPSRTLWLAALELRQPLLRLTRMKDGTIRWPAAMDASPAGPAPSLGASPPPAGAARPAAWRIHVESLTISGGVIEVVDEKPATPFHGLVDQLSVVVGPVTIASDGAGVFIAARPGSSGAGQAGMSFAVRGRVVGAGGASAPAYCSGWLEPSVKNLQASCRLEPLALTAFDPYSHGRTELRVYTSTLKSTSQWDAKANQLTARLLLEIGDLSEGDLSVRGRTIVDIKRLPGGPEPRLSGEISLSGPLDDPAEWQGAFQPGDERVQVLVQRLLEHGVTRIKIALGEHPLHVSVAPATAATMTDIEAASQEIQDALEILAAPERASTIPAPAPAEQSPPPSTPPEPPSGPPPPPAVPAQPGS